MSAISEPYFQNEDKARKYLESIRTLGKNLFGGIFTLTLLRGILVY